jgi:hypothetical protein
MSPTIPQINTPVTVLGRDHNTNNGDFLHNNGALTPIWQHSIFPQNFNIRDDNCNWYKEQGAGLQLYPSASSRFLDTQYRTCSILHSEATDVAHCSDDKLGGFDFGAMFGGEVLPSEIAPEPSPFCKDVFAYNLNDWFNNFEPNPRPLQSETADRMPPYITSNDTLGCGHDEQAMFANMSGTIGITGILGDQPSVTSVRTAAFLEQQNTSMFNVAPTSPEQWNISMSNVVPTPPEQQSISISNVTPTFQVQQNILNAAPAEIAPTFTEKQSISKSGIAFADFGGVFEEQHGACSPLSGNGGQKPNYTSLNPLRTPLNPLCTLTKQPGAYSSIPADEYEVPMSSPSMFSHNGSCSLVPDNGGHKVNTIPPHLVVRKQQRFSKMWPIEANSFLFEPSPFVKTPPAYEA